MGLTSRDRAAPGLSTTRKVVFSVLVPLIVLVLALVVVEVALHQVAEHYYGKGKLFQPDPVTGWRPLPNLDLVRTNANGDPWRVVTDEGGFRETGTWRGGEARRLLVLGDSMAFGEGASIEERFDSILATHHPDLSVINAATMGFGTFQQVLRGRPFFGDLRADDVLLMVTCSNDFMDVTRSVFAARFKPQFRLTEDGRPVEEMPRFGLLGWLRDKSYLVSRALVLFVSDAVFSAEKERQGIVVYETLVRRDLLPLGERGVRIVIAYYEKGGHQQENEQQIAAMYDRLCAEEVIECVAINDNVDNDGKTSNQVLRDGHWSPAGHIAVAEILNPLF